MRRYRPEQKIEVRLCLDMCDVGHSDEPKLDISESLIFHDFNTYTESKEVLGIELGRDALSLSVGYLIGRHLQREHARCAV